MGPVGSLEKRSTFCGVVGEGKPDNHLPPTTRRFMELSAALGRQTMIVCLVYEPTFPFQMFHAVV